MNPEDMKDFSLTYSPWRDKPVVLLVKVRQYFVPLPCSIIGETDGYVRVCVQPGLELKIRKELIAAIEGATAGRETWIN
jgi:hypothetical protein